MVRRIGAEVVAHQGTKGVSSGTNVGGRRGRVVDYMPPERRDYSGMVFVRFEDGRGRIEVFDWIPVDRLRELS